MRERKVSEIREILERDYTRVEIRISTSSLDVLLYKSNRVKVVCLGLSVLSDYTTQEIATTIKMIALSKDSCARTIYRHEKDLLEVLNGLESVIWNAQKGVFEGYYVDEIDSNIKKRDIIPRYCSLVEQKNDIITIEDRLFRYTIDKSKREDGFSFEDLNKK